VPFRISQPELVTSRGRVGWRCVDGRVRVGGIAVLHGLQRVNSGGQWSTAIQPCRAELHGNRAIQFERSNWIRITPTIAGLH